jgi:hypothetical protein
MPTYKQPVPIRITVTVPYGVFTQLRDRADHECRSTSNLSAFHLQRALRPAADPSPHGLAA